jgi:uncharacterized protein YbjT (DUF2867 family)
MILVTGATGLNGKELLRVLSASGVALRAGAQSGQSRSDRSTAAC